MRHTLKEIFMHRTTKTLALAGILLFADSFATDRLRRFSTWMRHTLHAWCGQAAQNPTGAAAVPTDTAAMHVDPPAAGPIPAHPAMPTDLPQPSLQAAESGVIVVGGSPTPISRKRKHD